MFLRLNWPGSLKLVIRIGFLDDFQISFMSCDNGRVHVDPESNCWQDKKFVSKWIIFESFHVLANDHAIVIIYWCLFSILLNNQILPIHMIDFAHARNALFLVLLLFLLFLVKTFHFNLFHLKLNLKHLLNRLLCCLEQQFFIFLIFYCNLRKFLFKLVSYLFLQDVIRHYCFFISIQ